MTNRAFVSSQATGADDSVVPSQAIARSPMFVMVAKSLVIDVRMLGHSPPATGPVMLPTVVFGRAMRVNRQAIHRSPDSAVARARLASEKLRADCTLVVAMANMATASVASTTRNSMAT